jgi:signal transduction histidine kinase
MSGRVDALELLAGLLAELDTQPTQSAGVTPNEFYNRLCRAVCESTSMRRAALFLYEEGHRHRVRAVGGHGLDTGVLAGIEGTLEETPLAQRAFSEDRVVEVSEGIEEQIPAGYAKLLGITTLTCIPLAAGRRWLGVILADRGGGQFTLTEGERQLMWTLGKTVALAAAARIATRQQERARQLSDRIDLAREIHQRVVQRLFGVALVLGAEKELSGEERERCRRELQEALTELRSSLRRPLARQIRPTSVTLKQEFERLGRRYRHLPLQLAWEDGAVVPEHLEPLAQSVLAEAIRNVNKHASPARVEVRVQNAEGAFVLTIENDGAPPPQGTTGMGLRLAAFEALELGGLVEFGRTPPDQWRVALIVPVAS